jgi:hypothetical protein
MWPKVLTMQVLAMAANDHHVMEIEIYCHDLALIAIITQHCKSQISSSECFADQIDPPQQPDQPEPPKPIVAVYVDDMIVKTPRTGDLIDTLDATFANLRRFSIKLNLKKCTFMVPKGNLLGYIVSEHGIKANPGHCQDGPHTQCERRTTAHRLFGLPQSVHILTR